MHKALWKMIAVAGVVSASWVALVFASAPFLWISGIWVVFFLVGMVRATSRTKYIWFNLAFLTLVFGALEAYMWIPGAIQEEYAAATTRPDDVLGYAPLPGEMPHRMLDGDVTVFDVTYTIGDDGLRVTPPAPDGVPCILFFGGSFTFGHAVQDDENLPYLVGERVSDSFRVHNFGYRGYGPHQMLSSLRQGRVDATISCEPRYIVYSGVGEHIDRVNGRASWDGHGPWFDVVDDELVPQGNFDNQRGLSRVVRKELEKSPLIAKILARFRPDIHEAAALYGLIVSEAARLTRARYPTSEFHVIFWDRFGNSLEVAALTVLSEQGLTTHRVSNIIPDFDEDRPKYEISEHDHHPSPLAYRAVADYVLSEIVAR